MARKLGRIVPHLFSVIVLLATMTGCRSPASQLRAEILEATNKADEVKVYSRAFTQKGETLSLKVYYKKGTKEFNQLMTGLVNASEKGTVAKMVPDRKIIVFYREKRLIELDYCTADGRIEKVGVKAEKIGVLFLPSGARRLVN